MTAPVWRMRMRRGRRRRKGVKEERVRRAQCAAAKAYGQAGGGGFKERMGQSQ